MSFVICFEQHFQGVEFRIEFRVIIDILLGVPVLVYRLCQVAVAIVGIGLCPALRVRVGD